MTNEQFLTKMSVFRQRKKGKINLNYQLKLENGVFRPNMIEYFVEIGDVRISVTINSSLKDIHLKANYIYTGEFLFPAFVGNDMQYLDKVLEQL